MHNLIITLFNKYMFKINYVINNQLFVGYTRLIEKASEKYLIFISFNYRVIFNHLCSFRFQVRTFLIMYRAHCQRILDTILRANFGEVIKLRIH